MTKIYIDVCCWNRPFDDQTQARVHLEAEAVLAIVFEIERGDHQLLHSEVVDLEIANTPAPGLRQRLQALIPPQHRYVRCEQKVSARALELEHRGFPASESCKSARLDAR